MTERTKGILAAVVILGCFALLGYLVHEKADGATTAAIATVTIVVAWLTRSARDPKDPPSGVVVFAGVVTAIVAMAGCSPAKTPREQARSVVLTVAEGVRQGDLVCASIAKAKSDLSLAEGCAVVVREAREALLAAEDGVDAWEAASSDKLPCATKSAASALARLLETVRRAGGKTPPAVDDALKLAPVLAGACHG